MNLGYVASSSGPVVKSEVDPPPGVRTTATGRLLRAYRERGDLRARDRVAQLYRPLVDAFARCYEHEGAGYDGLMRAGSTGLMEAIQRYVPRRDEEFASFAVPMIVREIKTSAGKAPRAAGFDLRDDRVQLAAAFHGMDEAERQIVHLRFVEELPSAAIAVRLGLPEAEVARRTQTALSRIRAEIERLGSGQAAAPDPPADRGAPTPDPPSGTATDTHSGRLLLRMPQLLHTQLANAAEDEQVSLNQFITKTLAAGVGWQQSGDDDARPPVPAPASARWLRVAIVANIVVLAIAAILAVVLLIAAWQDW